MDRVMPAGSTRTTTYYAPFPVAIERGDGYRLWDVDGNEYIDALGNYTAHIHGNAHPSIIAAVELALRRGFAHPAPLVAQAHLAEQICARVPSVEKVRFTNSGNEAVMVALRAARAVTGRDDVVKAIGGYHGSWEQVAVGSSEDEHLHVAAGEQQADPGVPTRVIEMLHSVRYNDVSDLEATMAEHGGDVAAILLEPVLGHTIEPASGDFLRRARQLADEYGALLILDEVITLRLHEGGVQTALGVRPDLTTMGKIIGGGFPVGGIGGGDVMAIFDPRNVRYIEHHGTFNGNALTMAAGSACLDLLPQSEIDRINALGERLAARLGELLAASALNLSLTSTGSLMNLRGDPDDLSLLHRAALDAGVFMAPRGMMCVSTVMDDAVIDEVIARLKQAIVVVSAEIPDGLRASLSR
jgi:glutamate-1-semialdehyde 2,1-aminomutase